MWALLTLITMVFLILSISNIIQLFSLRYHAVNWLWNPGSLHYEWIDYDFGCKNLVLTCVNFFILPNMFFHNLGLCPVIFEELRDMLGHTGMWGLLFLRLSPWSGKTSLLCGSFPSSRLAQCLMPSPCGTRAEPDSPLSCCHSCSALTPSDHLTQCFGMLSWFGSRTFHHFSELSLPQV